PADIACENLSGGRRRSSAHKASFRGFSKSLRTAVAIAREFVFLLPSVVPHRPVRSATQLRRGGHHSSPLPASLRLPRARPRAHLRKPKGQHFPFRKQPFRPRARDSGRCV